MLPQMQERIAKCEAGLSELTGVITDLRANISELREQLQVERQPTTRVGHYPMDCVDVPTLERRKY